MLYIKDLFGKNRTTLKIKYTVTELLNEAPLYAGFVNLDEIIEKMTVYRWSDGVQSHWEMILQTQTEARIKLDINQELQVALRCRGSHIQRSALALRQTFYTANAYIP